MPGVPSAACNGGNNFTRSRLSSDEIRRIIDAAAARGVAAVSFTGGEPLLFLDDLIEYIRYAGRAGIPLIRTGTNGFLFMGAERPGFRDRINRLAAKLAATPLRNFWISIDSADPALHEAMRGFPGVIEGIAQALPIFHDHGLYPSANLGLNRNMGGLRLEPLAAGAPDEEAADYLETCREHLRKFYGFVIDLGFTMVNTCYPMSVDESDPAQGLQAAYAATSTDGVVRFQGREKALLFQALFEVIPEFRQQIRIFSPRTSLRALIQQYRGRPEIARPCRGGVDFFFVDAAHGLTYPCGYRGAECLGRFEENQTLPVTSDCRLCDWECFRGPFGTPGPYPGPEPPGQSAARLGQGPGPGRDLAQGSALLSGLFLFRRPPSAQAWPLTADPAVKLPITNLIDPD